MNIRKTQSMDITNITHLRILAPRAAGVPTCDMGYRQGRPLLHVGELSCVHTSAVVRHTGRFGVCVCCHVVLPILIFLCTNAYGGCKARNLYCDLGP